jgi:hypothetical protein
MITRQFGDGGWAAGCAAAPPPLHVYDTESAAANWFPLPRPALRSTPPGPALVAIPIAAPFGDDPTDPTMQTAPRQQTTGMIGRFRVVEPRERI